MRYDTPRSSHSAVCLIEALVWPKDVLPAYSTPRPPWSPPAAAQHLHSTWTGPPAPRPERSRARPTPPATLQLWRVTLPLLATRKGRLLRTRPAATRSSSRTRGPSSSTATIWLQWSTAATPSQGATRRWRVSSGVRAERRYGVHLTFVNAFVHACHRSSRGAKRGGCTADGFSCRAVSCACAYLLV